MNTVDEKKKKLFQHQENKHVPLKFYLRKKLIK